MVSNTSKDFLITYEWGNLVLMYCDLWTKEFKIKIVDQSTARDFMLIALIKNMVSYIGSSIHLHATKLFEIYYKKTSFS